MYKSVLTLFSGAFLGKIVGFIRELIIAYLYGTSLVVGAFRIAQSATLVPAHFFTTDALNAGFIPLYNRYKKRSFKKAQSLFWILKIAIFIGSLILAFILYKYALVWIGFIAPGFSKEELNITITFLHIMALGVPFYLLSNLYSYLAIANGSYFLASIRPTIQSIGMIIGVFLAYYFNNISLFAWGFSGAYIIFFLLGVWQLKQKNLFIFYLDGVKEIISEFWQTIKPLLLLPIFLQGNILIEKMVSSYMGVKVVASVEYAKFITETGVVLLAVPFGLVGLSTLSAISFREAREKLLQIIKAILIFTVPISLFLILYSDLIIALIFKRGAFLSEDVLITKTILIGFAIGFWAQVASYIMIKALNAQHLNKKVAIFMVIALVSNAIFNIIFYKFLGAITIGIGSTIYAIILFFLASFAFSFTKDILKVIIPLLIASVVYYIVSQFFVYKTLVEILVSILIFIIYWILFILISSDLKEIAISLIKLIRRR